MTVYRTDTNQVFDGKGRLVSQTTVQVDVTDEVNADTLRTRAQAALDANSSYLAIASPTSAQAVAQVGRLTRECSALIRLLLGLLDSVDGT